jgi:hypothetical protein
MEYKVIFDVSQTSADWWFPAVGLLFLVPGLAMVLGSPRGARSLYSRLFSWGWVGFAALWTLGAFVGVAGDHIRAVRALESGEVAMVEGVVENFQAETLHHKRESFTVGGVGFDYSEGVLTPGFRQTRSQGGPLRDGVPVQVWSSGGHILKLAVSADTPYAGPAPGMPLGLLAVLLAFPLIWVLVALAVATLGGWRGLAQAYPASGRIRGAVFIGQSLSLGLLGSYRNCLEVTVEEEAGIHLIPMLLFRVGHPAILIPWSAVADCAEQRQFLWQKTRVLLASRQELVFAGPVAREILRAWQVRSGGAGGAPAPSRA